MKRIALGLAAAAALAWSLGPVLWVAGTAIKPDAEITASPAVYGSTNPTLEHFHSLLARKPFLTYLANSVLVAGLATALALVLAIPAARALAHRPSRRARRILLLLLLVSLFPPILLLFPLYEVVRALGWVNHLQALILPDAALALPLTVWILEAGFRQIPRELDEAARLDGLRPGRRLLRLHLPLAAPSLAASGILSFLFCWNEFLLALAFATRDGAKTVTAGIASVSGSSLYEIPWGPLSAAVMLATAPVMLLVLLFERRITAGLLAGTGKA